MTKPDDDIQIIEFPNARPISDEDEQKLRRFEAEAQRLSRQPKIESDFRMATSAERLGVPAAALRAAVDAIRKERDHEHKRQEKHEDQKVREQERSKRRAEQEAERVERKAEKEAERKAKEKAQGFTTIARWPVARHAKELQRLAKKLGEDVAELRREFEDYLEDFLGVGGGEEAPSETEPWPEPIDIAVLLSELSAKISRYAVMTKHYQMTAAVLWTAHCWLYDHDVPVHSPMLAATSAEANSGKSTLVVVVGHATPRFKLNIETTGPTLYRYVDQFKPTMGLDEADDIFKRRGDLKHIINAGWTRGAKIPRQERIGGVWRTVWFDPFTPKAIALLGSNLPPATRTRCIEIRMLPKRPDETVEDFKQVDDPEFAVLRRKLARWAADNAAALKDANPSMPSGLNNRNSANWKLLLAIAELAGGTWPQRAREAAIRLTHTRHRPSNGVRLLAAFKQVFSNGRKMITSADMVVYLSRDPTSVWADFNHGGPVSQRQIALLMDQYEIDPVPIHPTGRSDFGRMGYKVSQQFLDAFARYLPVDPIIQSPSQRTQAKRLKPKRR